MVIDEILQFAYLKLMRCNIGIEWATEYKQSELPLESTLAPICMRFLIDWNQDREKARILQSSMITGNSRIAFTIPGDGGHLVSGTPSEPLLAEVAARYLNTVKTSFDVALRVSVLWQSSLIHKGYRGELAARLLLLFAFDRAVDKLYPSQKLAIVRYSKAVPVLDFLRELFAERWHEDILNCPSDARKVGSPTLRQAFEGAWVRFSHFARSGDNNPMDTRTALAAVVRGMAFQLGPQDEVFHIAIPIVMKDEPLVDGLMSYIYIQLRDPHERAADALHLEDLEYTFLGDSNNPYIFMTLYLDGAQEGLLPFPTTADDIEMPMEENASDPQVHSAFRIVVTGCSPDVYRVVDRKMQGWLSSLTGSPRIEEKLEHPRRDQEEHAAIVQRLKVEWDRGREVYDWIAEPALHEEVVRGEDRVVVGW